MSQYLLLFWWCSQMLADVEDDMDVQAARMARAEETAEMAEFDENFSSQTSASTAAAASSKEVEGEGGGRGRML